MQVACRSAYSETVFPNEQPVLILVVNVADIEASRCWGPHRGTHPGLAVGCEPASPRGSVLLPPVSLSISPFPQSHLFHFSSLLLWVFFPSQSPRGEVCLSFLHLKRGGQGGLI